MIKYLSSFICQRYEKFLVYLIFIIKIIMAIARPFSYNTGSQISGTTQVGDLAVGFPTSGFTNSPQFWNGPNEELGYVIAVPVSGNTQPTPLPGVFASLKFFRTSGFTDNSFINLSEYVSGKFSTPQTFTGATEASTWLTTNGFWNSYSQNGGNGLTPETAGDNALQIKTDYPSSQDGLYWIKNNNISGGTPFQIYADMTTDGGGWTLLLTNQDTAGWTYSNAILLNQFNPVSGGSNYSIVTYADYLKSSGATFQYMIDAYQRNQFGGIWSAPSGYTFVNTNNTQTSITLDIKFGTWNYNDASIEQYMPWRSTSSGLLTTSSNPGGEWWGTLVTNGGWNPAPWISGDCGLDGCMPNPGIIWYWVR
jgi:hypothetical protein